MILDQITPLLLTFNEAPNLARTLAQLAWATRIIVVDSGSTDDTLAICKSFSQVEVITREFDTFAGQCNFGLTQIQSPWVLSLDADYVLTDELVAELRALAAADDVMGFYARFTYCIHGRPLRASLYPPRTVLYRKDGARYADDGHGHRVQITGKILPLASKIEHDDRKPLERWLGEQLKYSAKEAAQLTTTPAAQNSVSLRTLNLSGSGTNFTLNGGQTLTLSAGGLLKSGGASWPPA